MTLCLELRGATKEFPGVKAMVDVNIQIQHNEVVGLVGENGAGKSTLLKILSGVYQLDGGEMLLNNVPINLKSARDSFDHGIGMVFQEQSILLNLSIAENIFLGREDDFLKGGVINKKLMLEATRFELEKVKLEIDPRQLCDNLTFAQRQLVEIAKALSLERSSYESIIILLDEPTSVLEKVEIELLFDQIDKLKSRVSFIFVSHRLNEVLEVSDRIYVMRNGHVVGNIKTENANLGELHKLMVGRELKHEYYKESRQIQPENDEVLNIRECSKKGVFNNITLTLNKGDILGIAGVIGSGREELARCLAGLDKFDKSSIQLNGERFEPKDASHAIKNGICYIPRDRRQEGILGPFTVAQNITLSSISLVTKLGIIKKNEEKRISDELINKLGIKTQSCDTIAGNLSGGNQQKVVLAKWRFADSKIVILDHPTRGIDVGAKEDVYNLIRDMTDEGLSIILLADTLEELIGLSHRIIVMKDGEITQEFDSSVGEKPKQIDIIPYMV